ncbi:hypothetical protein [Rhizobium rhizophilum]|uniref:hypothetical protein n=1 Tax=Rhizobium rhizophilum TaxID=1850373 RepID=UPI0014562E88|nr:hypothetical protein [Rhizobium rhizophilum]
MLIDILSPHLSISLRPEDFPVKSDFALMTQFPPTSVREKLISLPGLPPVRGHRAMIIGLEWASRHVSPVL